MGLNKISYEGVGIYLLGGELEPSVLILSPSSIFLLWYLLLPLPCFESMTIELSSWLKLRLLLVLVAGLDPDLVFVAAFLEDVACSNISASSNNEAAASSFSSNWTNDKWKCNSVHEAQDFTTMIIEYFVCNFTTMYQGLIIEEF